MYWLALLWKRQMTRSVPHPKHEHSHSVNNFECSILENHKGFAATLTYKWTIGCLLRQKWLRWQWYYVLKWVSTESRWHMALHLRNSKGSAVTWPHNRTISRLSMQEWLRQYRCDVSNMSVNWASTFLSLASSIIKLLWDDINPSLNNLLPIQAKMLSTTSYLCTKHDCQPSVIDLSHCIFDNQGAVRRQ